MKLIIINLKIIYNRLVSSVNTLLLASFFAYLIPLGSLLSILALIT